MHADHIDILRSFYEMHRRELYTYALSLTRSRESAEDAIQNAFRNLLGVARLPAELRPYVFRCVRNAAIDERRLHRREAASDSIFAQVDTRGNGHDPSIGRELQSLLDQLGESERECIVLKIYNGLTLAEIGDVCGAPMNTAASWYRRGLEKLRAMMEDKANG